MYMNSIINQSVFHIDCVYLSTTWSAALLFLEHTLDKGDLVTVTDIYIIGNNSTIW